MADTETESERHTHHFNGIGAIVVLRQLPYNMGIHTISALFVAIAPAHQLTH